MSDVPLAYIPGNVTRVKVKAVGDMAWPKNTAAASTSIWDRAKAAEALVEATAAQGWKEMKQGVSIIGLESY